MNDTPLSVKEPASLAARGIIVVQEAFGVNDHIVDVTGRFAAEGYLAVAPHLFHRDGDPTFAYDDTASARESMNRLTPETVLADIDAAIAYLSRAGIKHGAVGIVGFCMGGSVALVVAARRHLGAAVTFYGGGVSTGRFGFPPLVEEATRLQTPWLGLFGDRDAGIPVEDVESLRVAAAASSQPNEVVRYPDAGHGFHCDARGSYHEASAKDTWARSLAWFDNYLSADAS